MRSHQQFFAELKRRNVFKVSAVYGAVAFGLIQVADPLADAMRLPDVFVPFVVALLVLGFPVAVVLAWAFELSPQGVRKMEAATAGEIEAIVAQPASQRWPAGLLALAGVALLVAGAWWAGRQSGAAEAEVGSTERADAVQLAFTDPAEDERPSIAVLPFVNMSADPAQEYFSDGMTEEILNVLAKIRELRVAARTSAFALKDVDLTATELGDTLDVEYFAEGSVRKAGDRLRITAQLIDTSDGSHLWSESYDRDLEDVFAIQTEIAEAIAAELRVPLGLDEGERLANTLAEAEDAAVRALELDPNNASATVALANVHRDRWEWEPAEAAYRRALELDPDNFEAHQQYAEFLGYVGRLAEASEAAARSLALDRSPIRLNVAGYLAMHDDRIEAAIRYLDQGIQIDPDGKLAFLRGNRALAHMMTDEDPAGRTLLLDRVAANSPEIAERAARVWPPTAGLPTPEAIEVLEDGGSITPAQLWMLIDRPERAIEQIVALRDRVPFGQTDHWWSPVLDPLRDDPGFVATQEAWGLAGYELRRTGDTERGP